MRLFTAIELSDAAREHLGRVMRQAGPAAPEARWTRVEKLHLTLKFIGEVQDADVPGVIQALEGLSLEGPIALQCTGIACFPPRGRARVIAAEVDGDLQPLADLFERIDDALVGYCRREHRRYTPHVTIGRSNSGIRADRRDRLRSVLGPLFPGPVFECDGYALLSSAGGVYTVCHRFE